MEKAGQARLDRSIAGANMWGAMGESFLAGLFWVRGGSGYCVDLSPPAAYRPVPGGAFRYSRVGVLS